MGQGYSVFISAVTREFGVARDALANKLQARGIVVKVQRSFELGEGSTLDKLHDYIKGCDRVIAVIGTYSGMFPPDDAVTDAFRKMLPAHMTRASMTQWEVIFAREYKKQIFFFEAADFTPEQPPAAHDDAVAQAAWRDWLFDGGIGRDRACFANADALRADVMSLPWPDLAQPKPSNLPISIGRLFKGREEFLDKLRASFEHKPAAAITGKAVHGLGGIGKTRAAIEYGHAHRDDYTAQFFLTAKSENDLKDSLAALTGATVLNLPEKDVPDLDARVAAMIHWLRAHPGWLLIIDNVDDEPAASAVRRFMEMVSSSGGHVLITSRVSDWGHMVEPLELDLLSVAAAKDLLLEATPRRTKHDDEDEALTRLADDKLGCLSLALVQAAAFIDEKHIGFADYITRFDKESARLLAKLGPVAIKNLRYPLPVALTWAASFAHLSDAGRLLLDMLAFLSIEPIPRSLIDVWPEADAVDLDDGLSDLTRYSFVHWEGNNSGFTVHRLVAQVTRDNLDDAARERALTALFPWLKVVNPAMNAGDIRCWPKVMPLLPHALAVFERTKEAGPYPAQTALYNDYATLLQSLARYRQAEPPFRHALAIDEASYGRDHPEVATRLNNLAGLLRATNRLAEAEPLFRRALAIDEASYGPDHPKVAIRLNNLASLLQDTNRLAEAEPLFRRALAIDEASLGPDHPNVAIRLNNLASLLQATNRLAEAEPLFRRAALILLKASKASGHLLPNVRVFVRNYAGCLNALGKNGDETGTAIAALMTEAGFDPAALWPHIFGDPGAPE